MLDVVHNERILGEALPHGVVILQGDGTIVWLNKNAKKLLPDPEKLFQTPEFTQWFQKRSFESLIIEAPHDPEFVWSMLLRPYCEDQCLLIFQDITQTTRLRAMRQDFIANVSHELRTPLTVFRGFLELLLDDLNVSQDQLVDVLQQMHNQAERMDKLVQDLLWLSRLESFQPDPQQYHAVTVSSLLQSIVEDAKALSGNQHQFELEIDNTIDLTGDSEEIRSAFSNLVYNAVHYTPPGGTITIRWHQAEDGKHLQVIDTGIGIPAHCIPRVTRRFYRVDKARSNCGKVGTGLGLAIVKHVVLRHQGQLLIESTLGEGSTFDCVFPPETDASTVIPMYQSSKRNGAGSLG